MEEPRPNAAEPADTRPWLALYICLQLLQPVLMIICSIGSWVSEGFEFLLHLLIGVANFVLRQGIIGKLLVGLSWKLDTTNILAFEIVPDPFVPTQINSNCFWIGTVFTFLFWVVMLFKLLAAGDFLALVAGALVVMEGFNMFAFFRAQKLASRQSFEAVRQVLLGKNSAFPNADEIEDSDSDTENVEEKKEEEEIV